MRTYDRLARGAVAAGALGLATAALGFAMSRGSPPQEPAPAWMPAAALHSSAALLPILDPPWRRGRPPALADAEALLLRISRARGDLLSCDADLCGRQVVALPDGTPLEDARAVLLAFRVDLGATEANGKRQLVAWLADERGGRTRRRRVFLGTDAPVPDDPGVRATKAYLLARADAEAVAIALRASGADRALDEDGPWVAVAPSLGAVVVTDVARRLRGWERTVLDMDGRS